MKKFTGFERVVIPSTLLLWSLGLLAIARADDIPPASNWQGTIGKSPVVLRFGEKEENPYYYYGNSLQNCWLQASDSAANTWVEYNEQYKVTGTLVMTYDNKTLSGKRIAPNGKQLPFQATFTGTEEPSRVDAVTLKSVKGKLGSHQYETISVKEYPDVTGLQLLGDARLAPINEWLKKNYLDNLKEAIDCRVLGWQERGKDNGYDSSYEARLIEWNKSFVVTTVSTAGYSGGAHPYHDSGANIYNLQTGETEKMDLWLTEEYRSEITADSALGKILFQAFRHDRLNHDIDLDKEERDNRDYDYNEVISFNGDAIWPTSKGLVFQAVAQYYAASAFEADILIPYKDVIPYLSELGKKNIQAFKQ